MANKHAALVDLLKAVRNTDYFFTTITPLSHQRVNARLGNQWAKNSESSIATNPAYFQHRILRDIFGWSRAFYELDIDPEIFSLMQKAGVLKPYEDGLLSSVRISTFQHEKFGKQFFMHSAYPTAEANAVFFGPDTYRYLHEINSAMCQDSNVKRAVDIGCGAGPGAILTALHHPLADVYAVDINQLALELTSINATVANTKNVIPLYSDLLSGVDGNFDLITANPPYLVDKDQRTYRHGGEDLGSGLSYDIVESAVSRLNLGGSLLLYTGVAINDGVDGFKNKIVEYLQSLSKHQNLLWSYREIDPDVFGEELDNPCYAVTDRIAAVVLKVTTK
ncbi:MAG TPA: class I SAM-dependent methyltransferase [Methylotenera sp.]|nr:class I SAM-dependent methyltransferase [Methylotenera sp.]